MWEIRERMRSDASFHPPQGLRFSYRQYKLIAITILEWEQTKGKYSSQFQFPLNDTCILLAKSLAREESLLATFVTPWRTLSFTSSKSGVCATENIWKFDWKQCQESWWRDTTIIVRHLNIVRRAGRVSRTAGVASRSKIVGGWYARRALESWQVCPSLVLFSRWIVNGCYCTMWIVAAVELTSALPESWKYWSDEMALALPNFFCASPLPEEEAADETSLAFDEEP